MEKLEIIIKNNLQSFNDEEPFEGHIERFANKLNSHLESKKSFRRKVIYRIAAAAIITLLIGISGRMIYMQNMKYKPVYLLSNISEELKETEYYYNEQIEKKFDIIKNTDFAGSSFHKYLILKELNRSEEEFKFIRDDLKENPHDERIVNAVIMQYQTKLEVMDKIIEETNRLEI